MKILGIGNAIVDVICKVSDEFIIKNNLTKGLMKLIFHQILNQKQKIKTTFIKIFLSYQIKKFLHFLEDSHHGKAKNLLLN